MPGFDLASIVTGAVSGLGDGISKVVDSMNAPKVMVDQTKAAIADLLAKHQSDLLVAQVELEKQHTAEKEGLMLDVQNARNTNMSIQTSDKPGWLSKNIPYCLAIFMTSIWGTCTIYIIFRMLNLVVVDPKIDMTSIMAMYAGITGLYATVLNFYFGSTHSSKDKDATIQAQAVTISNQ